MNYWNSSCDWYLNAKDKFYPYSISINTKETSSMMNCIYLKDQPVYPLNHTYNGHKLYSNLKNNLIWFFNENGKVKYKKMEIKAYSMGDIEESKNECQDKVWCCKPTRACNIDIQKIDWIYSEIERGNISHNADKFEFSKDINLTINESIPNSTDFERLHKFFGLFETNSKSKIETNGLTISYPKEQRKNSELLIDSGYIFLLFEEKYYIIHTTYSIWLSGLFYISNNKKEAVIKLTKLDTSSSTIERVNDTSFFYPIWLQEFKDHCSTDSLNMYALINK